jgi:hypothetical protein
MRWEGAAHGYRRHSRCEESKSISIVTGLHAAIWTLHTYISTGVDDHQLPIAEKMVVSSIMYNQCVLPICALLKKAHRTNTNKSRPTRMRQRGRTQDDARRPAHRHTQSAHEDPLQTAQAEQIASSFHSSPISQEKRQQHHSENNLTFACARALISADRLHDLHLAPTLYAPQRADERLERPPLPQRRGNNVQICLRLRVVERGPRIPIRLAAREVFEEEPRPRGALMPVLVLVVVTMMSVGRGGVVHVFGAREEGA